MWPRIATSAIAVVAFIGSCDDAPDKPTPPQRKTESRAAAAVTKRDHCTRVDIEGAPAVERALARRGYCATGTAVLTVRVVRGKREGSAVFYGAENAATLLQTEIVRDGRVRNLGVRRRAELDERTVVIELDDRAAATAPLVRAIARFAPATAP
jgi:hypothetical protein